MGFDETIASNLRIRKKFRSGGRLDLNFFSKTGIASHPFTQYIRFVGAPHQCPALPCRGAL